MNWLKKIGKTIGDVIRNGLVWVENLFTLYPELDPRYDIAIAKASSAKGDCDDKAKMAGKYLKMYNLPYTLVIGKHMTDDKMWHAWIEVLQDGNRYVLDPSAGQRGWMYKNPKSEYFYDKEFETLYWAAQASIEKAEQEAAKKEQETPLL